MYLCSGEDENWSTKDSKKSTNDGDSTASSDMIYFNNDMMKQMERVRKEREKEGQFWENEIRQMNRWY